MGQASSSQNHQNILLLGIDGSGKSSVLSRLMGDDPRTVLPTLGFTTSAFAFSGDDARSSAVIKVWDQGGTPAMRRYWPAYYRKAHSIAFVIDSADRHRLAEASAVLQEVLEDDALIGIPLLVIANKQDAPNAIPAGELEELMHLGSIRDRTWRCLACSALRGVGLTESMRWLADVHAHVGVEHGPRNASLSLASRLPRFRKPAASSPDRAPPSPASGTTRTRSWRRTGSRRAAADDERDEDEDNEDEEAGDAASPLAGASASPSKRSPGKRVRLPGILSRGGTRSKSTGATSSSDEDDAAAPVEEPPPRRTRTARARRQEKQAARKQQAEDAASDDDAQSDD